MLVIRRFCAAKVSKICWLLQGYALTCSRQLHTTSSARSRHQAGVLGLLGLTNALTMEISLALLKLETQCSAYPGVVVHVLLHYIVRESKSWRLANPTPWC